MTRSLDAPETGHAPQGRRPRIGFLGVGWIGRSRMAAMLATGSVEVAGIAEPDPAMAEAARALAPQAVSCASLEDLLRLEPDGVVIATPSALHAPQSLQALQAGVAVFCQKPLGRTVAEAEAVVGAARRRDRLLGVDLSYRHTAGMRHIRDLVASGALGEIYAADLIFHNAYGPDKPWFYDPARSGGGCVIDLGIHLVDLALWVLGFPAVTRVTSHLYAAGEPLVGRTDRVEDYAIATLELASGTVLRLACSWHLHAGRDAVIAAEFHGTKGGAAFRNVEGSFYDFTAEHFTGTARKSLAIPPDEWGGRAAAQWAQQLTRGSGFDPAANTLIELAAVIDRIYARG